MDSEVERLIGELHAEIEALKARIRDLELRIEKLEAGSTALAA